MTMETWGSSPIHFHETQPGVKQAGYFKDVESKIHGKGNSVQEEPQLLVRQKARIF